MNDTNEGQRRVEMVSSSAASVIEGFFRYEGVELKATVSEMGDAERLLMWLQVNGFKIVRMTHLDCDNC